MALRQGPARFCSEDRSGSVSERDREDSATDRTLRAGLNCRKRTPNSNARRQSVAALDATPRGTICTPRADARSSPPGTCCVFHITNLPARTITRV